MSIESQVKAVGKNVADERERALTVNRRLAGSRLFGDPKRELAEGQHLPWRISPDPVAIDARTVAFFEELGPHLHQFYIAANRLYNQAVRGSQPDWVRAWLETGKSEEVVNYARMRRFRADMPLVIRPDVIPTDDGYVISELDSVPGGIGLLAALTREYAAVGADDIVGGVDGMIDAFIAAMRQLEPEKENPVVAIVVSDESNDYRGEMTWLAEAASERGLPTFTVHPADVLFAEGGLFLGESVTGRSEPVRIDIVYRFFELFDLRNIPKIDLILYAIRKEWVKVTPPLKHHLEEKMLFALFHHPALTQFWRQQLGQEGVEFLAKVFPPTWVMDPTPLPPHAVIPGLEIKNRVVTDWRQLKDGSQRERELVIKPSGYSPEAWGSRGVVIGHDLPQHEWGDAVERALAAFSKTPHILQRFRKGSRFSVSYYDFADDAIKRMHGRARLCPYYFVVDGEPRLAGVLATIAPLNKKAIHGMVDAVMAPAAVR